MNKSFSFSFLLFLVFLLSCKADADRKNAANKKQQKEAEMIEKGKEIASNTFLALSGELQKAMKSGGIDHALTYCNENALAITDSLSSVYNVDIKRTSLKWRNPKNKPSPQEIEILNLFEKNKDLGEMFPLLNTKDSISTFYAPIIVQDMCLKCHGAKDEITNYDLIKQHYPDDLAFGYNQGDLRGMWSIRFK